MTHARADAGVALVVLALGVFELSLGDSYRGPLAANLLMVAAASSLLLARRRFPLGAGVATFTLMAVMAVTLTRPSDIVWFFVVCMVVAFRFGLDLDGRKALAGLATVTAGVEAINLMIGQPEDLFPVVFMGVTMLAGRAVRSRSRVAAELHETALLAEEARQSAAARATADERRRIAREMHDVVAHSMSVMVVQAGGARRILDRDVGRATAAAEQIERTGREALAEMRRLLGVLGDGDGERAPQPGLDGLEALVRRAGVQASLDVVGERPALPAGLELAVYRIVQESLTNVIKHAGGAPALVHVRYGEEEVEVQVDNEEPSGRAMNGGAPPGHGLLGMRERVRVFGGELECGRRPEGGFRVRARLPRPS